MLMDPHLKLVLLFVLVLGVAVLTRADSTGFYAYPSVAPKSSGKLEAIRREQQIFENYFSADRGTDPITADFPLRTHQ